jgi:hypothetical protein
MWSSQGFKIDKEYCGETGNELVKLAKIEKKGIDSFGIFAKIPNLGLVSLSLSYEGDLRVEYKDVYLYLRLDKKAYQRMIHLWNTLISIQEVQHSESSNT